MYTGGKREPSSTRTRQYISFVILALFLGLFVSAMTGPASHMIISLPPQADCLHQLDMEKKQLFLHFPHIDADSLKTKCMHPFVRGLRGGVRAVTISPHAESGSQIVLQLSAQAAVRLLRFTKPHQVMVNVVERPCTYNYKLVAQRETVYRSS